MVFAWVLCPVKTYLTSYHMLGMLQVFYASTPIVVGICTLHVCSGFVLCHILWLKSPPKVPTSGTVEIQAPGAERLTTVKGPCW